MIRKMCEDRLFTIPIMMVLFFRKKFRKQTNDFVSKYVSSIFPLALREDSRKYRYLDRKALNRFYLVPTCLSCTYLPKVLRPQVRRDRQIQKFVPYGGRFLKIIYGGLKLPSR